MVPLLEIPLDILDILVTPVILPPCTKNTHVAQKDLKALLKAAPPPCRHLLTADLLRCFHIITVEIFGTSIDYLGAQPDADLQAKTALYDKKITAVLKELGNDLSLDIPNNDRLALEGIANRYLWLRRSGLLFEDKHCHYTFWPLLTPQMVKDIMSTVKGQLEAWHLVRPFSISSSEMSLLECCLCSVCRLGYPYGLPEHHCQGRWPCLELPFQRCLLPPSIACPCTNQRVATCGQNMSH